MCVCAVCLSGSIGLCVCVCVCAVFDHCHQMLCSIAIHIDLRSILYLFLFYMTFLAVCEPYQVYKI